MPLSHSSGLDGFAYGIASGDGLALRSLHQKRKLDYASSFHSHGDYTESSHLNPKRFCHRQDQKSQEELPGCLKDVCAPPASSWPQNSELSPLVTNTQKFVGDSMDMEDECHLDNVSSLALQHIPYDSNSDITTLCNNINNNKEIEDVGVMTKDNTPAKMNENAYANMDSDCVPNMQQYHTPSSEPRQISAEKFCGFFSCRGQKPSPVSGRLCCHCQASWRGMYGIDCGFCNDYY